MILTDPSVIKGLLAKNGFSFKKSLGQNFLINPEVCPRMADSAVEDAGCILEIGPGIGVLTAELAQRAEKVVAVELDERLRPVLGETLSEYKNTEVVFDDVMKLDLPKLLSEKFCGKDVAVCANLPYYITSPIIMGLLESRLEIKSLTVMVQREAAERICAEVGSRESGAVSVAVSYYSRPEILFSVSRGSFMPSPNVDSAVIKLNVLKTPPVTVADENGFFRFVRASFCQRRKTLVNAVSSGCGYSKDSIKAALACSGCRDDVRAEKLSMTELADVFNRLASTL